MVEMTSFQDKYVQTMKPRILTIRIEYITKVLRNGGASGSLDIQQCEIQTDELIDAESKE